MGGPILSVALVAIGGALGALARYFVSLASARYLGTRFPFGTFFINVSGSFVLGLVITLSSRRLVLHPEVWRLGLAIGFLGAYTTFSTFELESHRLLEDAQWLAATINLAGSVLAGLIAVRLGMLLAGSIGVAR